MLSSSFSLFPLLLVPNSLVVFISDLGVLICLVWSLNKISYEWNHARAPLHLAYVYVISRLICDSVDQWLPFDDWMIFCFMMLLDSPPPDRHLGYFAV